MLARAAHALPPVTREGRAAKARGNGPFLSRADSVLDPLSYIPYISNMVMMGQASGYHPEVFGIFSRTSYLVDGQMRGGARRRAERLMNTK